MGTKDELGEISLVLRLGELKPELVQAARDRGLSAARLVELMVEHGLGLLRPATVESLFGTPPNGRLAIEPDNEPDPF